MDVKHKVDDLK